MNNPTRILFAALTVTLSCPFAFVQQSSASRSTTALNAASPAQPADASANPSTGSNVTTSGGTVSALPLWTTSTNVQDSVVSQTGSSGTAKIIVRGTLAVPATGAATASAGRPSEPINLTTSSFNSDTNTAVGQTFQLRSKPVNNNTSTPSASLDFLFAHGSAVPAETGLKISDKGIISFAPDQRAPGAPIAMVAVTNKGSISRCYNATLDGAAATTPPCGINASEIAGQELFYFNFQVDNRFVSATLNGVDGAIGTVVEVVGVEPNTGLEVTLLDKTGNFVAGYFTVIVY